MSSVIRHIHYKPELEELSVWLGPEHRRYKYFDVPQDLYEALRNAPSRGSFYNRHIEGRFECIFVEPLRKPAHRWAPIRSAS
ncbi:MAG: KTSC domain-containing protein [Cypionkella sp.]